MSRVIYLVAASEHQGIKDALARGWTRIAMSRFATQEKDDVRVISRLSELTVLPGGTPMVKGSDYESGPDNEFDLVRWAGNEQRDGEKARFDRFVAEGNGEWME